MDIKVSWRQDFLTVLSALGFELDKVAGSRFELFSVKGYSFIVNLISLDDLPSPEALIALQENYDRAGIYCVQLWEDIWIQRPAQVIGRISSILGRNKRIHARKTKVIRIPQDQADLFLNDNHLQGSVKARYKYGLLEDGKMVAVATFSNLRLMPQLGKDYRSAELIRFAALSGYTVVGGFTKMLRHFIGLHQPNDVMSYADRDWSLGHAYLQSGFQFTGMTPALEIWLNRKTMQRYFPHRIPTEDRHSSDYLRIFNTGNLKYILYLSNV